MIDAPKMNVKTGNGNHLGRTDENIFRVSQSPNQKPFKAPKGVLSKVLPDQSRKHKNEMKHSLDPQKSDKGNHSKIGQPKKEVPLLQRLKVINASRAFSPKKPLPKEVIVENDDGDGVIAAVTVFSELGVDGLLSASTVEKFAPMKFTFDGIVPSQSSLDEIDIPPTYTVPVRDFHEEEETAPTILEGLEYELDDESVPGAMGDEELLKVLVQGYARTERCRSTNTELSIELSESQYLRNCEEAVEDKFKIFSPQASFECEGKPPAIDHGFDVILQSNKGEMSAGDDEASSPWINFNLFGLW